MKLATNGAGRFPPNARHLGPEQAEIPPAAGEAEATAIRGQLFVDTLVVLSDTLVDDFDIIDMLTLLAQRCVELLEVSAAGVMLMRSDGGLQVVGSSSEEMRILELYEVQANEGQCIDAFRTGDCVSSTDLEGARVRWLQFAARALASGFRAAEAVPLRLRDSGIGALNLCHVAPVTLEPSALRAAQVFADLATIAVLQHNAFLRAQEVNSQLNNALESRVIIEQAKGVIAQQDQVDVAEAFEILRHHSRSTNTRLIDIARAVVNGELVIRLPDRRRAPPKRVRSS